MADPIQPANLLQVSALSYRDPSGFVFEKNGIIYRQVNNNFQEQFDQFINSGCYEHLVKTGLLLPHETTSETPGEAGYLVLKPEKIPFISYPYEWSFSMLKDSALLTLRIVREALKFGMMLKDASPYNIQWYKGRLIFIDTLSFEKYDEKEPWIAYRQFCESFLAPLMIMHYRQHSLQQLFLGWPDGIPLPITSSLLPLRSRWSLHGYLHIHLHARIAEKSKGKAKKVLFTKQKFLNLITSLEVLINRLQLKPRQSTWTGYYEEVAGRGEYLEEKKKIISRWLAVNTDIKYAIDLGANEGEFSKLLAHRDIQILATDLDPYCIDRLYLKLKTGGEKLIQPLVVDLANPSPSSGLNNEERHSFLRRATSEFVLALGLVHHLAIGRNIPFSQIANLLARLGKELVIEFIPKEDEKVQWMLRQKPDIYDRYDEMNFEAAFREYFQVRKKEKIPGSPRILYQMSRP